MTRKQEIGRKEGSPDVKRNRLHDDAAVRKAAIGTVCENT